LITMLLGGLWHGAGINFIIWGFLQGIALIITHFVNDYIGHWKIFSINLVHKALKPFLWLLNFSFITFSWIFFNTRTTETAFTFIDRILKFNNSNSQFIQFRLFIVLILVIFINFFGDKSYQLISKILKKIPLVLSIFIIIVFLYLIINLGPSEVAPFVYFNF
jgi:alginate O-acetyltransferase complex protein AlgI